MERIERQNDMLCRIMTRIDEQMVKELEKLKEKVDILEKEVKELRDEKKEKEKGIVFFQQIIATHQYDPNNSVSVDTLVGLIYKKKVSPECRYIQAYSMKCRPYYSYKTWMGCATVYEISQLAICVYNHWSEDIRLMLCPGCYIHPKKVEDFDLKRLLEAEEIYRTRTEKLETAERSYLQKVRKVIELLKNEK